MKPWLNRATNLLENSLLPPRHEMNEIDWKVALSSDSKRLSEHLCAFANHPGGGFFAFGVQNDGTVAGIDLASLENIAGRITNLGREGVDPPLQLDYMASRFQEKDLLFVHVPEAKIKPIHLRGKAIDDTFIRSGGTTRKGQLSRDRGDDAPQPNAAMGGPARITSNAG